MNIGGVDGANGAGGAVTIDASASSSRISTLGYQAPGLLAQSVGGGGGVSTVEQPLSLWSAFTTTTSLGATGRQGPDTASLGGQVSVIHGGVLTTQAGGSPGIMAQSVGGGGGLSTLSLRNTSLATIAQRASVAISLGGNFDWSAPSAFNSVRTSAGTVSVANNTGRIVTQGGMSPGVFAQSVGGGGGAAIITTTASLGGIDIQLGNLRNDTVAPFSTPVSYTHLTLPTILLV